MANLLGLDVARKELAGKVLWLARARVAQQVARAAHVRDTKRCRTSEGEGLAILRIRDVGVRRNAFAERLARCPCHTKYSFFADGLLYRMVDEHIRHVRRVIELPLHHASSVVCARIHRPVGDLDDRRLHLRDGIGQQAAQDGIVLAQSVDHCVGLADRALHLVHKQTRLVCIAFGVRRVVAIDPAVFLLLDGPLCALDVCVGRWWRRRGRNYGLKAALCLPPLVHNALGKEARRAPLGDRRGSILAVEGLQVDAEKGRLRERDAILGTLMIRRWRRGRRARSRRLWAVC